MLGLITGLVVLVLVLFLPGYFLCLGFFPSKKEVDGIERLTFSFVFSITFLPLLVLIENQLIGLAINFESVLASLLFLILIGLLAYLVRIQKIAVPEPVYRFLPKIKKSEAAALLPWKN